MTSPHADSHPLDELLAQRGWVRALARRLARDEFAADDLEQDAWLAALRHPPRPGTGLGAWFARVMHNRSREIHRGAQRLDAREQRGARPEETRSAATLVAEAEAQRRVIDAVLALSEPLRETVLLRFFEGLPPREIASRTGVPVETVRTRLKRAAELLRATLAGHDDGGEAWLGALAPLIGVPHEGTAAVQLVGGAAMKTTTKIALASVLLAVVGAAIVMEGTGSRGASRSPADVDAARAPSSGHDRRVDGESRREREGPRVTTAPNAGTASDAAPPTSSTSPATGRGRVTGRVVLADGSPAAGAAVRLPPPFALAWTVADPLGNFVVDRVEPGVRVPVWVLLPGWRAPPIEPVNVAADETLTLPEIRLVKDERARLHGVVRSTSGRPIVDADVRLALSASDDEVAAARGARDPSVAQMLALTTEAAPPPSVAELRDLHVAAAADGSFELVVPALVGSAGFVATAKDHVSTTRAPFRLATAASDTIDLALRPIPRASGQIVDAATGAPIAGASVTLVRKTDFAGRTELVNPTATDSEGRFDVVGSERGTDLYAVADGYALESVRAREDGAPLRVALRKAFGIGGRVLAGGRPVKLAYVWVKEIADRASLHDASVNTDDDGRFELSGFPAGAYVVHVTPLQLSAPSFRARDVEAVRAGTTGLDIAVEPAQTISGVVVDDEGRPLRGIFVQQADIAGVTTDRDGRFVLPGSVGGPYVLRTTDFEGSAGGWLPAEVRDVAAGAADVRIVLKRGASISGVVVDEDGRPVVGRRVVTIDPVASPFSGGARGPTAATDAEGRFAIRGLIDGTFRLKLDPTAQDRYRVWLAGGEAVRTGTEGLRLTLTEGGTISGTVADAAGTALPRVLVAAAWRPEDDGGMWATTDEGGRFEFRGLPPGRTYTILAEGTRVLDVAPGRRDVRLVAPR